MQAATSEIGSSLVQTVAPPPGKDGEAAKGPVPQPLVAVGGIGMELLRVRHARGMHASSCVGQLSMRCSQRLPAVHAAGYCGSARCHAGRCRASVDRRARGHGRRAAVPVRRRGEALLQGCARACTRLFGARQRVCGRSTDAAAPAAACARVRRSQQWPRTRPTRSKASPTWVSR